MNEFFAKLVAQLRGTWNNLTVAQRIWISVIVIGVFSLLVGVIMFANRTVFVELGTFDFEQAAQIKVELDKRGYRPGLDYRLSNDGKTIEVDAKKRNEMHLALAEKGLFGNVERGFSIFENFNITSTDYEQRLLTLEALKSEMRSMLRSYNQIEDVAISVPHIESENLFIESEVPQTASVVLTLKPGSKLDDEQVKAIRSVIAGGFPGLTEEKITLTDQNMRPLIPEESEGARTTRQQQIVKETEQSLEEAIRKVIGPVLGNNKFSVSVSVDYDWDNVKINQTNYSSPGFEQLLESQQTEDEKLSGQGLRPGGEPGVASNTPPVYNSIANVGPIDYSRAEKIVNYLADKTVTDRIRSPFVRRISAAVAVDGDWKEETDTAGKTIRNYVRRTAEDMDHIKAMVQASLGHNPQREDLIEVRNVPWNHEAEWKRQDELKAKEAARERMMLFGALAAPLLIILLFLYAAWRRHVRLKEEELARQRELERQRALAAAEAGLEGTISLEEQERQEIQRRATSLARAKPKVVAELIRTWMAEDAPAA